MINKVVKVLENSFSNEITGCEGVIKKYYTDGEEIYYKVALSSKYYGNVFLKENEFKIIN